MYVRYSWIVERCGIYSQCFILPSFNYVKTARNFVSLAEYMSVSARLSQYSIRRNKFTLFIFTNSKRTDYVSLCQVISLLYSPRWIYFIIRISLFVPSPLYRNRFSLRIEVPEWYNYVFNWFSDFFCLLVPPTRP